MYSSQEICNVQVRIKCCYADMIVQFIEARALGDLEEVKCWRLKLLQVEALYYAFCQYWPVIEKGIKEFYEIEISLPTNPVLINPITIEGVPISDAIKINSALAQDVVYAIRDNINNRISDRDNELIVVATEANEGVLGYDTVSLAIKRTDGFKVADGSVTLVATGNNITLKKTVTVEPDDFVNTDPFCLSEDELQLLIDKFNALCGCGCAKGMFSDELPKYLN